MLAPYQASRAYLPAHLQAPLRQRTSTPLAEFHPLPLERTGIEREFSGLRSRLAAGASELSTIYDRLVREIRGESSRQATFQHREHEPETLLEQYVLYDQHFIVFRVAAMEPEELAAQFSRTALGLISDLSQVVLARDTLDALMTGVGAALELFGLGGNASHAPAWEAPDDELSVVRFRWLTGHHLFGLWSHLGGDALRMAGSLLEDPEGCAREIERSRVFLRATSAAMEYATGFPGRFYREVLRPEMEAAPMPGGFSGTQNADYNHMKMHKGKLHAQLVLRYRRGHFGVVSAVTCPRA